MIMFMVDQNFKACIKNQSNKTKHAKTYIRPAQKLSCVMNWEREKNLKDVIKWGNAEK